MRDARRAAITAARKGSHWGVVQGTLGRQGNPRIVQLLQQKLAALGIPFVSVLLSEVTPPKLALMGHVDTWVQVACPRLSIDWGEGFAKPTLTPYEALVALGEVPGWWEDGSDGNSSASGTAVAGLGAYNSSPATASDVKAVTSNGQSATAAAGSAAACCGSQGAGSDCGSCGTATAGDGTLDSTVAERAAATTCSRQGATGLEPYPMDYYARDGGAWNSSYHKPPKPRAAAAAGVATPNAVFNAVVPAAQ